MAQTSSEVATIDNRVYSIIYVATLGRLGGSSTTLTGVFGVGGFLVTTLFLCIFDTHIGPVVAAATLAEFLFGGILRTSLHVQRLFQCSSTIDLW